MFLLFIFTIGFSILTALLGGGSNAKPGNLKDFTFPQIGDGDPLIYAAGTVKIAALGMVWYGDFHTEAIQSGGLFGTDIGAQTVGYRYYLGWQLVTCIGPNVRYKKIWFGVRSGDKNEVRLEENDPNFTNPGDPKVPTPIWQGDIGTGFIHAVDKSAFGGDTGGGGYDLNINTYTGDDTQTPSAYLQLKIQNLIPAWKGVAYLVARGYVGNSPILQNMNVEIERIYDALGLGVKAIVGAEGDANPANVIYELMTNNFGASSIPLSMINTDSFIAAGNTLYDEDEGISISFGGTSVGKISQVLQDIFRQIDAVLYQDPLTGLINIKLIRNDYDPTTVTVIDISNIADISNYTTNLWSDTKNRIRVKYSDRKKDYDDRVAVGDDMANIDFQQGQVKGLTAEHPYIKRKEHANRKVAQEMAIYSTPINKITAAIQRIDLSLRPGSVVHFNFVPYQISEYLRVLKVNLGNLTNNKMTIDMTSDKFRKAEFIYVAPDTQWSPPNTNVSPIFHWVVMESPRWFNSVQLDVKNPDSPRVLALPFAGNTAQQAYNLWLERVGDTTFIETNTNVPFAEYGFLDANMAQEYATTSIQLDNVSNADSLNNVTSAQIAKNGLNLLLVDNEIIGYETYTLVDPNYVLTTIHRGLLDTPVTFHAAGARVVFLTTNHVGSEEFTDGDTIDVRMCSIALGGTQDVNDPLVAEAFV